VPLFFFFPLVTGATSLVLSCVVDFTKQTRRPFPPRGAAGRSSLSLLRDSPLFFFVVPVPPLAISETVPGGERFFFFFFPRSVKCPPFSFPMLVTIAPAPGTSARRALPPDPPRRIPLSVFSEQWTPSSGHDLWPPPFFRSSR